MPADVSPEEAARLLRAVRDSQDAVRTFPRLPRWYGPAVAAAIFVFLAVQDSRSVPAILAVELLYCLALGIVIGVAVRQAGFQPPVRAWRRYWKAMAAWIGGLVAVGAGCFAGLTVAGFRLPGTVTGALMASGFVAFGRWVRSREWTASPHGQP